MNWTVTISDEPDAPGPRYRVALNIGDDYIPLEPQNTLDAAKSSAVVAAESRAAIASHETLASSRLARVSVLIAKRGAR